MQKKPSRWKERSCPFFPVPCSGSRSRTNISCSRIFLVRCGNALFASPSATASKCKCHPTISIKRASFIDSAKWNFIYELFWTTHRAENKGTSYQTPAHSLPLDREADAERPNHPRRTLGKRKNQKQQNDLPALPPGPHLDKKRRRPRAVTADALGAPGRQIQSTPTAREIRTITMVSDMAICIIVKHLDQRPSSGASVGPNVELCVN